MIRYLVAADADQIQTFLFRSSHLREVIGGSRLLASFCDRIKETYKTAAIISGGGSFRMDFENKQDANEFIEELADRFYQDTGNILTVAGPIEYDDVEFHVANQELQHSLMEAKLNRPGSESLAFLPIAAQCASCGINLAVTHASPAPEVGETSSKPIYLCESCRKKAEFRSDEMNSFYNNYRNALYNLIPQEKWIFPGDPADAIGSIDATQYVAYLIADGNGMGKLFNQQKTKTELGELSDRLETAIWKSLAAPVPDLISRLKELKKYKGWCPIVPLIAGGDDLFVLVPARYSLDIARVICEEFEKAMEGKATLGVAVVICQSHYPYMLAHEHGEQLLNQAKKVGKAIGGVSTINFDVIVGNEKGRHKDHHKDYQPTMKPYFAGAQKQKGAKAGMSISTLLECRLKLKNLPNTRKSELRALFDPNQIGDLDLETVRTDLGKRIATIRQRVDIELSKKLGEVLSALGGEGETETEIWRSVERGDAAKEYFAQGLPDLIEIWDYGYRLGDPDVNYQVEEK